MRAPAHPSPAADPSHTHRTPPQQGESQPARLRRLAAKPLKPLKLAASAIARSGSLTPVGNSSHEEDLSAVDAQLRSHSQRSGTASSFNSTSDMHLDPTDPKPRKRLSFTRKKDSSPSLSASLDPLQIALAARGPRRPLDGEEPAAVLRVRVVRANDLVAKDRNGFSDPFVTMTMAPATRFTTPVVKRCLDPVFPPESSTFDYPIYLSLASVIGGRGLEAVMWDKDLMRKEYMGEFNVGAEHWFGGHDVQLWSDNLPVQSFGLISSRRRQKVSGTVSLQIGFIPVSGLDAVEALKKATSVYDAILSQAFIAGGPMSVLGVPAHEGIGTVMMSRDGEPTSASQFRVLGSVATAPFTDEKDANKNHHVFEECDLSDDGMSSSDDEMEDALEGDDSGYLRESPQAMDQNPLDIAGEKLLSSSPSAADAGKGLSSGGSTPLTPSGTASARRRLKFPRKGKKSRTFHLSQGPGKGVQGIVVMEVSKATDLPKLKSALRVGYDMDPFVVISFGKKVFRTRVIRHSLNPTWDEKLLFHVHGHETGFTIQMAVLDWDKVSGNDMVGRCTLPLAELMAVSPKPDPDTGLYAKDEDGKHDVKEFTLPIVTAKDKAWEARHSPTLTVRAKYEPYDALRQRFWRQYALQYDSDDTGELSLVELTIMLDSLGSTLTHQTIESFFTRVGKNPYSGDELTLGEVVQALEEEVTKPPDQKRKVTISMNDVDANELSEGLLASWQQQQQQPTTMIDGGTKTPTGSVREDSKASTASVGGDSKASTLPSTDVPSPASSDVEDSDQIERVINIRECPLCRRPRLGKRSEKDIVTHLAVCASADWNRVDRIMAASYVTSSQAQRKLLTKLVNKVAVGRYSLGANSANTIVQDRMTGQLQEEKMAVYVRIGIRVLYKGARSQMARARAKKLLKSLSVKQGIKYDSPASAADIAGFIAFHRLNVNEIADPLDSFKTFNEFFYRKLRPDARPIDEPENPSRLVSMADCRMMAFNTVSQATQIWIKGRDFTVSRLLGPQYASEVHKYEGGGLAILRLAPQDYHRFHSPVRGRIGKITLIDGEYYTVNPQAIRSSLDVYGENVRQVVPIESEEFGTVMTVWVGAMMVGSIGTSVQEGEMVERGQELGWFAFGGSTIVTVFETGRVTWDQDLQDNASAAIETLVRVGMGVGRASGDVSSRAGVARVE
ncbi:hypothetical protein CspeluHIS016_0602540 [Cutaneotrichosporon spelunceum]|uniref:phosphatidylserine decarboxylase n=1 Tax=Cutaneotrichosporon spelunceum TaxID=1672016 RepID=A0AAD3TYM7_9TREE|nr:hypothetical protein CspeluHIS016_0602540 [Cutaneotrichosporon spelunceum]